MWALRRASIALRSRGFNVGTSRACCIKLTPTPCVEDEAGISESPQITYNGFLSSKIFYHTGHTSLKLTVSGRGLSSQADVKNTTEEGDLEDGFSELETSAEEIVIHDNKENDDGLISEPDLSDDNEDVTEPLNELDLSDTEIDSTKKKLPRRRAESELFKAIIGAPSLAVNSVMERWLEEGKDLDRKEVSLAIFNLRKRRMFGRALQLVEWLEGKRLFDFLEKDYASRLDLIAKVRGLHKAESYVETIPKSFRGELVYRTFLANCVSQNNAKKAEEIFNKMKDLELPVTAFACNQLLLLYKRLDKKKIADVLLLMEKENVKPSLFTYKILIDTKGYSDDVVGMEQIVETMKAEGVEPDIQIQEVLARHYARAGLDEKAEAVLKEMEGEDIRKNRWVCRFLLPIYANLGKADEVGRIWKICESNPRIDECMAAVEAWGKLKKIEEAEAAFELMLNKYKTITSRQYSVLLKVYANHKLLMKGKDLIKRMADSGCRIDPLTWDALVTLYVQAGEVEKADSALQKAIQQSQMKPMFNSYMTILDHYSKRGDVRNAEKIFHRMRQAGYTGRFSQYHALLEAYIKAKVPAFGIRERMKADNLFPNKTLANQIALVDPFRKTSVSDLLD